MVKREDIRINEGISFYGKYAVINAFVEYEGIQYVQISRRGILVPLTAIWKGKDGLEVT